jgi:hypothetical protein
MILPGIHTFRRGWLRPKIRKAACNYPLKPARLPCGSTKCIINSVLAKQIGKQYYFAVPEAGIDFPPEIFYL